MSLLVKRMGASQTKNYLSSQIGLTLIEVLIALAIIGIAMTAVIKGSTQNIRSTAYLQDKTIALWVAQEILTKVRIGVLKLSVDELQDQTNMLGKDWFWQLKREETSNKHINKIKAKVFPSEAARETGSALITLESYIYHAPKN